MTIDKKLNLKPFDLQKALAGEPVVTRDGREAKVFVYAENNSDSSQLLGAVKEEDGSWEPTDWFASGSFDERAQGATNYDLFMAPKTKTMWMAYDPKERKGQHYATNLFNSEKELCEAPMN